MATEKPSSEAAPPPQFQVDEAYEYRALNYFDFVTDEMDDQVRAAEHWFEAGASHAPSRFAPTIKESRVAVKIDGLCDFADAEDPPAPCCRRAPPCRPPPGRLLPPARPSCGGS
ncbi:protein TPX2-like [Lolium perenne]|uniref:protein TPX2-like n=1 Tax=Lolium perenne TaxID=4522 RepID=UPI0021F56BAF|nr:protein TPX2-like [Lolium perenne]